jgi:hypothetical protein
MTEIIRLLWQGGERSFLGAHVAVQLIDFDHFDAARGEDVGKTSAL